MTSRSSSPNLPGLERDKIIQVGLTLLDEVGLDGLTLRRLADRLGVKAAALYWHFHNKQELIDTMALAMIHQEYARLPRPATVRPWRELLSTIAHTHRRALLSRRDGARLMASADFSKATMFSGLERVLTALEAQGFSGELAFLATVDIVRYTLGCVFEEQTDPAPQIASLADRRKTVQSVADKYPRTAKTLGQLLGSPEITNQRQFEHGLELMLIGIDHMLASGQQS